jgi:hypothetical protein
MSATDELFEAVSAGDLARVKEILERAPEAANAVDEEGATALHLAALHGQREMVRALVAAGADINRRDGRFGATPAGWAIEYLREMGGLLAMEMEDVRFAVERGDVDWVRRFLERLPALAKTLMSYAEESGNEVIVALFRRALERLSDD